MSKRRGVVMRVVPNPRHWLKCEIHDLPCPFWQDTDEVVSECLNPSACEHGGDFVDYLRSWLKATPAQRQRWGAGDP